MVEKKSADRMKWWYQVAGVICDRMVSVGVKGKNYRTIVRPAMFCCMAW